MRRLREEGYVLAGALAALFAMSIVAAALVAASLNELRRVAAAERAAADDAALDAAILLAASELVLEPALRTLQLDGRAVVDVGGRSIGVTAGWESAKLDVNHASPEAIDAALEAYGVGSADRARILAGLEGNASGAASLVDDVLDGVVAEECARSVLTTFGGETDWTEDAAGETIPIGVPAPGSRIWIVADIEGSPSGRALEAVLIVTGSPAVPVRVLDIRNRRTLSGEECNGA